MSPIDRALEVIERAFRAMEDALPKAKLISRGPTKVFRFKDPDIHHAIVMKLARLVSLLRGAKLLMESGYVQEQGILHRAIDETHEDIVFLVCAVTNDKVTELHQRYLEAFWQEEFEHGEDGALETNARPMVRRNKIRAYISRILGGGGDPSTANKVGYTIYSGFSGFVHGAAPHIMDLYGGSPPKFHTQGVKGTPREEEYRYDYWNYVYRGLLSCIFAAKAFGAADLVSDLQLFTKQFTIETGREL